MLLKVVGDASVNHRLEEQTNGEINWAAVAENMGREQLDVYAVALERIYKRPVKARVLWFFATGRAVQM